jgi:hypothetical protein
VKLDSVPVGNTHSELADVTEYGDRYIPP